MTVMVAAAQALIPMPTIWRWALRIAAIVFAICSLWLLIDFLAEAGFGMWIGLNHPWWIRGIIGAIGGAVIWLGVTGFHPGAQAQGTSAMISRESLANALEAVATAVANAPPVIIGSRTVVTAGPGSSGTVIGKQTTVTAGPGARGTIIGEQTTVTAGGPNSTPPLNGSIADHLRVGAAQVRNGDATRGIVQGLLAEATLPGAPANVQAAIATANQALTASDLK